MIYCPYTDRDIPETQSSPEHIIPLSLGGINGLEISVDSAVNSQVGSKLDGALANEFVFALKRTKFDTRGHSGRKPTALIRKATYGEDRRPAQVHFHSKEGLKVWIPVTEYSKNAFPGLKSLDRSILTSGKVRCQSGVGSWILRLWGLVPPGRGSSTIQGCHEHRSVQARPHQDPCGPGLRTPHSAGRFIFAGNAF